VTVDRRAFIVSVAATAATTGLATGEPRPTPIRIPLPHRSIDQERCIGCGGCVPLCPMGAIALAETASIDPEECAECGVCLRSRVCPADAIVPGELGWPRTLRATFSDPLAVHRETGVGGELDQNAAFQTEGLSWGHDQVVVELDLELGR